MHSRIEKIELEAKICTELQTQLARFPVKPRGNFPSRTYACELANYVIESHGVEAAIAEIKKIADQSFYDDAPASLRTKPQITNAIIWDLDDEGSSQAIMRLNESLKITGRGNRTNANILSLYVRSFLEMQKENIQLPIDSIRPMHLKFESFTLALRESKCVGRSEPITKPHEAYRVARHYITKAAKIVAGDQ